MCALPRAKSRANMAIYHLSASIVKRSAGRSIVAAAAHRAGSKIEDLTTGLVHDYTRKKGVEYSEILSLISQLIQSFKSRAFFINCPLGYLELDRIVADISTPFAGSSRNRFR